MFWAHVRKHFINQLLCEAREWMEVWARRWITGHSAVAPVWPLQRPRPWAAEAALQAAVAQGPATGHGAKHQKLSTDFFLQNMVVQRQIQAYIRDSELLCNRVKVTLAARMLRM